MAMRLAPLLLVPIGLGVSSCDILTSIGPQSCDRSADSNEPVLYKQGTVDDHGIYESSPADGELLYFPGGMRYRIEHGLGQAPIWWELYLSFSRYGISDGGTLAPAAGNQAEIVHIDSATMVVVNGSCSTYWLRVVAGTACGGWGAACSGDSECCSGSCLEGACFAWQQSACRGGAEPCTTNLECCSLSCEGGTCASGAATCTAGGSACVGDFDCCSLVCEESKDCAAGSFRCRGAGSPCAEGFECCSLSCEDGTCG
jgi:hypothetical protein